MNFKEGTTLVVSLASLAISVTSSYYNLFRTNIHGSLILQDDATAFKFAQGGIRAIAFQSNLTFVNDGNRPIAILGLTLSTRGVHRIDKTRKDCQYSGDEAFDGIGIYPETKDFSPVVVKPNEIAIVPVKFYASKEKENGKVPQIVTEGSLPSLFVTARDPSGKLDVVSCLEVRYTTSAGNVRTITKPISFSEGQVRGDEEGEAEGFLGPYADGTPIELTGGGR